MDNPSLQSRKKDLEMPSYEVLGKISKTYSQELHLL